MNRLKSRLSDRVKNKFSSCSSLAIIRSAMALKIPSFVLNESMLSFGMCDRKANMMLIESNMDARRFFAGGFLYNPKNQSVLLHKRDGNTAVNPHKWGFFGGLSEGDETPIETFTREMKEELDIDLVPGEIVSLCDYLNEERNIWRYVFLVESDRDKSTMRLGEGADFDWIPLSRVFGFDLTDKTAADLRLFAERVDVVGGDTYE